MMINKMKICFIGACGHYLQAYNSLKNRNDVQFSGFAPGHTCENSTTSFDAEIPFYSDYLSMLDETKPDLAIVSPVFGITSQVIIECAKRKIDVFSEKPVASSFEELKKVESSIKTSGIRFCAMHYLRYVPCFYHAKKMVKDGKIGNVKMITAQKSYKYGIRPDWYADRALYGGTIPWVGIHAIDWISDFTGKHFLSVTAQSTGDNPEKAALCQFELEDGILASANIDFYRPSPAPTHGDDRVRCVGTNGVIEVCDNKITLINDEGVFSYCPDTAPELLESFLSHKEVISPYEIFHITKVAIAARESADKRKTIVIGR